MTYDDVRGTAPLEPSPEQLARAKEHRVLPGFPESLSDPELRLIRRPPRLPLADSYRGQRYYFRGQGNHYVLAPERPGMAPSPSVEPPFGLPGHFISNWHKGGIATTFAECLTAQRELCAQLAELDLAFRLAIAVAEDRNPCERGRSTRSRIPAGLGGTIIYSTDDETRAKLHELVGRRR